MIIWHYDFYLCACFKGKLSLSRRLLLCLHLSSWQKVRNNITTVQTIIKYEDILQNIRLLKSHWCWYVERGIYELINGRWGCSKTRTLNHRVMTLPTGASIFHWQFRLLGYSVTPSYRSDRMVPEVPPNTDGVPVQAAMSVTWWSVKIKVVLHVGTPTFSLHVCLSVFV